MKKKLSILLIILIVTSFSQVAFCDSKNPSRKELERKIEKLYGFEVKNHTLKFCGICKKCLNKGELQ